MGMEWGWGSCRGFCGEIGVLPSPCRGDWKEGCIFSELGLLHLPGEEPPNPVPWLLLLPTPGVFGVTGMLELEVPPCFLQALAGPLD